MIGFATPRHWCMVFVLLFLGALGWVVLAGGRFLMPASADVLVWCCLREGQPCMGDYDPGRCAVDGIAYSREHGLCAAACASLLPPNGIPETR